MLEAYQFSPINPLRWSDDEKLRRRSFTCEHRHNGLLHPKCYNAAKGVEERKGCLDIEAGQLVADFDIVLSWAIKTVGKDEIRYDHLTHKDIVSGRYDSRIIATLMNAMWRYDRVIGHYIGANRFDAPFVRSRYLWLKARGMYDGPPFPTEGMMWLTDTYSMSKRCLKIASRRQDSVANTVQNCDIKTRIEKDYWMAVKYGAKKQREEALKYIVDHNLKDVEQLEGNYLALQPFCKEVRTSI